MIADTKSDLQVMAIQKLCPFVKSVNDEAAFGTCYGNECQLWQCKPIRGNHANGQEAPPIVYKGWCGLAGEPGE